MRECPGPGKEACLLLLSREGSMLTPRPRKHACSSFLVSPTQRAQARALQSPACLETIHRKHACAGAAAALNVPCTRNRGHVARRFLRYALRHMQRALRLGRVVRTEGATRDIVQARIQAKKRQLDIAVAHVQVLFVAA